MIAAAPPLKKSLSGPLSGSCEMFAQPSCTDVRKNSPAATDFGWLMVIVKSGSE
jgi:hypothetical protein